MDTGGVMSDGGDNTCITDSEQHLVGCHNTNPMISGLALKSEDAPTRYQCRPMGNLPMLQEDGTVHHQSFLVNQHATDSIMLPEAILQSCPAFTSWHQEGFKHCCLGTLQFVDNSEQLLLNFHLMK